MGWFANVHAHDTHEGKPRFRDISTRWSALRGPPRQALDYLYRVYGNAILGYIRGRLARGDFHPLSGQDAEDVAQDFFLRLGTTEWLAKPDPLRGRFRPYLVRRLVFFLKERRAALLAKRQPVLGGPAAEPAVPDPLDCRLERDWKLATVHETLRRIGRQNHLWAAVLFADLERDGETDADLARRMGRTPESFRSLLKRARGAFRETFPVVEERLDGFGERKH
jgi:DNA-directed RNA polymerase specialized sigma24 family protein